MNSCERSQLLDRSLERRIGDPVIVRWAREECDQGVEAATVAVPPDGLDDACERYRLDADPRWRRSYAMGCARNWAAYAQSHDALSAGCRSAGPDPLRQASCPGATRTLAQLYWNWLWNDLAGPVILAIVAVLALLVLGGYPRTF